VLDPDAAGRPRAPSAGGQAERMGWAPRGVNSAGAQRPQNTANWAVARRAGGGRREQRITALSQLARQGLAGPRERPRSHDYP